MFDNTFKTFIAEEISEKMSYTQNGGSTVTIGGEFTVDTIQVVEATNDLFYEPLAKSPDSVVAVFSHGAVSRSSVPDVDLNDITYNIDIFCDKQKKDILWKALNEIEVNNNAIFQTIVDGSDSYYVQMRFYAPILSATPYDTKCDVKNSKGYSESLEVIQVQWQIDVSFSNNLKFGQHSLKLLLNGTQYNINGLSEYHINSNPADAISQRAGQLRAERDVITKTTSYTIIIIDIFGDALCGLLFNECIYDGLLGNNNIILQIDTVQIPISGYNLSYDYSGGFGIYTLELYK
jgi:hypothetical protein